MKNLLELLYPVYLERTDYLISEIEKLVELDETTSDSGWYKSANLYVTYPDSFEKGGENNLVTLANRIGYIRNLGFNALHILPFLDSPMSDGGFDVRSYLDVRADLGGMVALEQVLAESKKEGVRVFMDLIMNHVSDQHEWFKKALSGDEKYRKFFIVRKNKPILLRKFKTSEGHFAEYDLSGVKSTLRIIFPQFEKELPHWVQGSDGYWYYHTFYQYQPDLDWYNPDVFLEFIKIIKFWSEKGMNFRLDAITFMAKNIFTSEVESNPNLHLILQSLNLVLNSINPEAVFMAETCQPMDVIKKYFGTNEVSESKLVYNFKMMQSIWYAYLTADSKFITETLGDIDHKLPSHASWVNFLRNHDELTLEFAPDVVRTKIYETLFPRGKSFIDGFGVSGRTFNFVNLNKIDLIFIYKVLASMPGIVAIIYGDEVAKTNDHSNILKILNYKKSVLGLKCEEDTRDLNRGILKDEEIEKGFDVYSKFSEIFNQRLELLKFFTANPKLTQNGSDYILTYPNQNSKLQIRINFLEKICDWQVF